MLYVIATACTHTVPLRYCNSMPYVIATARPTLVQQHAQRYCNSMPYVIATARPTLLQEHALHYCNSMLYVIATACTHTVPLRYCNSMPYVIATARPTLLQQHALRYCNSMPYVIATARPTLLQEHALHYCNSMLYVIATACPTLLQQHALTRCPYVIATPVLMDLGLLQGSCHSKHMLTLHTCMRHKMIFFPRKHTQTHTNTASTLHKNVVVVNALPAKGRHRS